MFGLALRRDDAGDVSALIKQVPLALIFAFAVVLVVLLPEQLLSSIPAFLIGVILVAVATVLAAVVTARPGLARWELMVPAVDFLALGALRYGTGGPSSAFVAAVILPVVWLAVRQGRRYPLFAAAGTAVALVAPLVIGDDVLAQPSEWIRAIVTPVAFWIAATIVNEVSAQSRLRWRSVQRLAHEREAMLEESRQRTRVLAAREAQLRGMETFMRNVWEATTEQIVVGTDLTGRIDLWNTGATRILGASVVPWRDGRYIEEFLLDSELDERSATLVIPDGETVANPRFAVLVDAAKQGRPDAGEWTAVRTDATVLPIHLSVTPRTNDAGMPVGYLFIGLDLTREREASRLKDDFIGLISHELRTPLSSILGYLELLRDDDDYELSGGQLQYLAVAERNAHRLLRLVGDLLFTAQVDSGKFTVDRVPLAMESIIHASLESARPIAAAASVAIAAEGEIATSVDGDAVRLGQALDNLISNAVKFTPGGGQVTVNVSRRSESVVISVSDTGIGIPADELDKLFGRFFRATTATRNAVPGVGLGLVITRAIVQAHGGTMQVHSIEGEGTTFEMHLPRAAEPAEDGASGRGGLGDRALPALQ